MKLSFYLATKYLYGNKNLFFLIVGILIFSFINISFFNSLNNGIEEVTNKKLLDYSFADLKITPKENEIYIQNSDEIIKKLERHPDIIGASARIIKSITFFDGKKILPSVAIGIKTENELLTTKTDEIIAIGDFLGRNNKDGIIIGDELIGNLDGTKGTMVIDTLDLGISDKVKVNFNNGISKDYRVQGIIDSLFWIPDFFVFLPYEEIIHIYNLTNGVSSEILINTKENSDKKKIKEFIINNGIEENVVDTIEDLGLDKTILESQRMTVILANIIGVFTTFIIVFIIIYINVNNNKKNIAVLKAIGIKENDIINSYVILSLIYAIFGILFGFLILFYLIEYIKINPIKLPMGYIYPIIDIKEILFSILVLIISSIFGGFLASRKIIKSDIIKILRGE